jgi:hypothetical protein
LTLRARGRVHIAVRAAIEINDIVNVFKNHLKSKLYDVFPASAPPADSWRVFDFCLQA